MAATTLLDVWEFLIVDPDDRQGHVIPLVGVFEGGESISGVILWILGQCKGQFRGQRSNISAHDSRTSLCT